MEVYGWKEGYKEKMNNINKTMEENMSDWISKLSEDEKKVYNWIEEFRSNAEEMFMLDFVYIDGNVRYCL